MAGDPFTQLSAEVWAAAAAEAYSRAGVAICDGHNGIAIALEWQEKAKGYARRSYIRGASPLHGPQDA